MIFFLFAAICCCPMNVQVNAQELYQLEYNGIHYVPVEMSFGEVTTRNAYVVHPQATIEDNGKTYNAQGQQIH